MRPSIVVIEYNANFAVQVTVPFDCDFRWDQTKYFGASLPALHKLGCSKFYTLVYANGVNAFFVRDDRIANPDAFYLERVYVARDLHAPDLANRPWVRI